MRILLTVICSLVMLPCLPAAAGTIRVPADQPTIQAGIDAAENGDTVLVADGTYTGDGNRDIDFLGKAITVRSENGAEHCIIDCEASQDDPHRGFYFHTLEGPNSVLQGFTIRNGYAETAAVYRGGGIKCENASPTITENIISQCTSTGAGGGIFCGTASPVISRNIITDNFCRATAGGGISCRYGGSPLILENVISENRNGAGNGGGIIISDDTSAIIHGNTIIDNRDSGLAVGGQNIRITNNLIARNTRGSRGGGILDGGDNTYVAGNLILDNEADTQGGGVYIGSVSPTYINNLIAGNYSDDRGGGVFIKHSTPTIINNTITGNSARTIGEGVLLVECTTEVNLTNCILWNNGTEEIKTYFSDPPTITHSLVAGGYDGEGNIDADPLFTSGPLGDFYLSSTQAGQPADSPCFDAGGAPSSGLCYDTYTDLVCPDQLTTRTDGVPDLGLVDMGWHYEGVTALSWLATTPGPAPGNPPLVRLFQPEQDAGHLHEFSAYGATDFGANVTTGDVTGTGTSSIITGAGPAEIYGPHVRGFAAGGEQLPGLSFLAYTTSKWGVNVSAGDIDGDGFDELITGPGPGAVFGPHVRGWDYDNSGSVTTMPGVSYFAYGTPKWGVNVACGDIDGDGFDELVTGAGPGSVYGPHVRGWDYDGTAVAAIPAVSFMAYGTNQYGVIDGLSFMAWPWPDYSHGASVFAGADLDGDGRDDLVVGGGPDPAIGTEVKAYRYDGSQTSLWFSLEAYEGMTHGVFTMHRKLILTTRPASHYFSTL